ncbi:NO signaling/Golgi transport ligand-binding domain [Phytophthora cactorum]|nr:NO signaling/Golgi transport ligand-binding domain [Phytophthora cactorum]
MALLFLVFPCGLVRGALANLGLTAIVNADVPDVRALPGCTYCS